MVVRLTTEHDIPSICAITDYYIAHTHIHFAEAPVPIEETAALWRQTRDRYPWLVADDSGDVIGYAKAGPFRNRAAYDWTCEAGIYVRHGLARRGVGRALYTRLFDILRAQGYRAIIGGVSLPNEASVGLHEAMGMRRVAVFPRIGFKFGRWIDVGFWQVNFDGPGGPIRTVAEALGDGA